MSMVEHKPDYFVAKGAQYVCHGLYNIDIFRQQWLTRKGKRAKLVN